MLEVGEPLHAFDYDVWSTCLDEAPTIITRTATSGEKLTTLDNVERELDDFTVLVCDTSRSPVYRRGHGDWNRGQ
jgi:phenylalanyl-tRNA synthetase beta chain